jgi:4-amino-4-deoxy-L-arabinose transferase-like glycosyltransferase
VGFLPLLILIPFAILREQRWTPRTRNTSAALWAIGLPAFLIAVGTWLVPMLLAANADPTLAAYRDEILFRQTVDRYASAWHHREPFYYFIVQVIPGLWLPLTLLLPWLIPQWRDACKQRDLRIALLLSWVVLVVLFFSFSSGKRGVYILPALPAVALASAPYLIELAQRRNVQRARLPCRCSPRWCACSLRCT